jgi:hypothetical protein
VSDYVNAWQCIGCGKIEAPQPCIGVCQDRRVQFVYAEDYEEALSTARAAERALDLVRKLAHTTPREDGWRDSYRAFQDDARRLLSETSHKTEDAAAGVAEMEISEGKATP